MLNAVLAAKVAAMLSVAAVSTTGAAAADVLPDPAQRLVANAASSVGVNLPGADAEVTATVDAEVTTGHDTAPAEETDDASTTTDEVPAPPEPAQEPGHEPADDDTRLVEKPGDAPSADEPAPEGDRTAPEPGPSSATDPAEDEPSGVDAGGHLDAKVDLADAVEQAQGTQRRVVEGSKELRAEGREVVKNLTGQARKDAQRQVRESVRDLRETAKDAHRGVADTAKGLVPAVPSTTVEGRGRGHTNADAGAVEAEASLELGLGIGDGKNR